EELRDEQRIAPARVGVLLVEILCLQAVRIEEVVKAVECEMAEQELLAIARLSEVIARRCERLCASQTEGKCVRHPLFSTRKARGSVWYVGSSGAISRAYYAYISRRPMKRLQPVIWMKGAFLNAQYLQSQDRFLDNSLQFQMESLSSYPWGFRELRLDQEAL